MVVFTLWGVYGLVLRGELGGLRWEYGGKRRQVGAVSRNNRKKGGPCRCWTGTLKNPTKCLWRWEPDRRYNFFFSPPAHRCHHIYDWNIVACDVRLGYCFSPYQRLWLYNGAPLVAFYDTLGIRRTYSRLNPRRPHGGACDVNLSFSLRCSTFSAVAEFRAVASCSFIEAIKRANYLVEVVDYMLVYINWYCLNVRSW